MPKLYHGEKLVVFYTAQLFYKLITDKFINTTTTNKLNEIDEPVVVHDKNHSKGSALYHINNKLLNKNKIHCMKHYARITKNAQIYHDAFVFKKG